MSTIDRIRRGGARALAGMLAFAVTAGVGHLVGVLIDPRSSPVLAVANTVVDLTPAPLREFAITTFGTSDKLALFTGLAIALVGLAALAGLLERRRGPLGTALLLVLAVAGLAAALARPGAHAVWAAPSVVGGVAGVATLRLLTRDLRTSGTVTPEGTERTGTGRRRFLVLAGSALALAAGAAAFGEKVVRRGTAVLAERAGLTLPWVRPDRRAAAPGRGVEAPVPDGVPFMTPADRFYRIDTALRVPELAASEWTLRIHGMVDREITLDWDRLTGREAVERIVTLSCVSNEVGGELAGNACWTGFPIRDLLDEVGVHPDADMLLATSVDGWTSGTPLAALRDGRDALLAVGMNGAPLPLEHGYPVRQVVPGLYGFVSACKWVVDWEVTRFDRARAYWTERGWAEKAPIKTASRIDRPAPLADLPAGRTVVAGTAWAQHRGVARVEVRVDQGPWRPARLADRYSDDTWRMWSYDWDAEPGLHTLYVRATDTTGTTQPEARVDPIPDGATGWHSRTFRVREAS